MPMQPLGRAPGVIRLPISMNHICDAWQFHPEVSCKKEKSVSSESESGITDVWLIGIEEARDVLWDF